MIETYILIMIVSAGTPSTSIHSQEFRSKQSCIQAIDDIKSSLTLYRKYRLDYWFSYSTFTCVKK